MSPMTHILLALSGVVVAAGLYFAVALHVYSRTTPCRCDGPSGEVEKRARRAHLQRVNQRCPKCGQWV